MLTGSSRYQFKGNPETLGRPVKVDQGLWLLLKAGLHVRRKHKHQPRVNRDDASTRKRNAFLFHVLAPVVHVCRPGSHVANACACVVRVNQP